MVPIQKQQLEDLIYKIRAKCNKDLVFARKSFLNHRDSLRYDKECDLIENRYKRLEQTVCKMIDIVEHIK
jgi:hypothetical protein